MTAAAPGPRNPRRRPHVAHRARVVAGSLAAAVMFALVMAMGIGAYRTSADQVVATTNSVSSSDSGTSVFDPNASRSSSSSAATGSTGQSSSIVPNTSSAPSGG